MNEQTSSPDFGPLTVKSRPPSVTGGRRSGVATASTTRVRVAKA